MGENPQANAFLTDLVAKTKFRSYSSSLSRLAELFKIKIEGWHQAVEDAKILLQVLHEIVEFLKANKELDIRKQQGLQAKRLRHSK
jgi:DNA polymerase III epsilon subunit-like protein